MKKLILLIILNIMTISIYAKECNNQNDYNINWEKSNNNLNFDIKLKNNKLFQYYNIETQKPIYIGFKIIGNEKINYKGINSNYEYGIFPISTDGEDKRIKQLDNIFENILLKNGQISSSLNSASSSTMIKFPFDKKYLIKTKHLTYNLDIKDFISEYKELLNYNKIYNIKKIFFYVILINESDFSKCSYFESPIIKYDFGKK